MKNSIKDLTAQLRDRRKDKGYTQHLFANTIGMPQSRLSRIENGRIDLQLSNFIELARSLDLEVMLIPRQTIPMVNSLMREVFRPEDTDAETPLYHLDGEEEDES